MITHRFHLPLAMRVKHSGLSRVMNNLLLSDEIRAKDLIIRPMSDVLGAIELRELVPRKFELSDAACFRLSQAHVDVGETVTLQQLILAYIAYLHSNAVSPAFLWQNREYLIE